MEDKINDFSNLNTHGATVNAFRVSAGQTALRLFLCDGRVEAEVDFRKVAGTLPRVLLTDYDRMPDDVDGEGSPFDLARGRTRTFGSRAYVVAESSPSCRSATFKLQPAS